jgi:hypothetical protein
MSTPLSGNLEEDSQTLRSYVKTNSLDDVIRILDSLTNTELLYHITSRNTPIDMAVARGNLKIFNLIMDTVHRLEGNDGIRRALEFNEYKLFTFASASDLNLSIQRVIINKMNEIDGSEGVMKMIREKNYKCLVLAVKYNSVECIKVIIETIDKIKGKDEVSLAIHCRNDYLFIESLHLNNTDIFIFLLDTIGEYDDQQRILNTVHINNNHLFLSSSSKGLSKIYGSLIEYVQKYEGDEEVQRVIHFDRDYAIKVCVKMNHLDLYNLIVTLTTDIGMSIHSDNYYVFRTSVKTRKELTYHILDTIYSLEGLEGVNEMFHCDESIFETNTEDYFELYSRVGFLEGMVGYVFTNFGHIELNEEFKRRFIENGWLFFLNLQETMDTALSYSTALCEFYKYGMEFEHIIGNLVNCKDKSLPNLAVIRRILWQFKDITLVDPWMNMDQACKAISSITPEDIDRACSDRSLLHHKKKFHERSVNISDYRSY